MNGVKHIQIVHRTISLVFLLSAALSAWRHPDIDAGWAVNIALAAAFWVLSLPRRRGDPNYAVWHGASLVTAVGLFAAAAVLLYIRVQAE